MDSKDDRSKETDTKEKKEKKDKKDKKEKKEKKEKKSKKEKQQVENPTPDATGSCPAGDSAPPHAQHATAGASSEARQLEEAPDEEEVDFWDSLGLAEEGKPEAEEQHLLKVSSSGEMGVLQVPPELADEVSSKIEQIATLTGASLTMRNNVVRVSGNIAARTRAERFACMLVEKRLGPDIPSDVSLVYSSHEWAQGWKGQERELEDRLGVLILFEELRGARSNRLPGQIVEVNWQGKGWHLATVLGPGALGTIRVRWSYDGSTAEVSSQTVRPAQRIAVCGRPRERVEAQVRILTTAEKSLRGVIATQLATCNVSGGLSLEEVRLLVSERTVWKMQASQLVDLVVKATGCVAVEFYFSPKVGDRSGESCALAAGTRDQRWLAGQLSCVLAAGMENKTVKTLPDHLLGECRMVKVPKDCMGPILGSNRRNLYQLMQDTNSVIVLTKEDKGKGKKEASEMDDLLELMFDHVREGPSTEFAIFGSTRARSAAEVRLLAAIETKFPGYHQKPDGNEEVDRSDGLGIDKLWLEQDFEPDATKKRSSMLSMAAGCFAEAVGKLVFVSGTKVERQRGREYAFWMVGRAQGKLPHVASADTRRDIVTLSVPREVVKNKWLKAEMEKLSSESKTWAFFDDWEGEGPDGPARMVLAGTEITKSGRCVTKLLEDAKQLVNDAAYYGKSSVGASIASLAQERKWMNQWGGWGGHWSSWGGDWQSWAWERDGDESQVPPPATPGGLQRAVPPPATPGRPQRGVPPPATPVPGRSSVPLPATPGGMAAGVAPPATPGGFGPHGNAAPCTPAPGGFGGFGPHGDQSPATPAPRGSARGVAPPATPAGFGPHGADAPRTPAPAGALQKRIRPPATPCGLRPEGNVAAPQTPALADIGGTRRVAAPQTPAFLRAQAGGEEKEEEEEEEEKEEEEKEGGASSSLGGGAKRRKIVPAPQTPAFLAEAAPPGEKKSVPAPHTPACLGKATTPGVLHAPAFPGRKKSIPAPHTPAFPAVGMANGSLERRSMVAAPATPAFPGDVGEAPRAAAEAGSRTAQAAAKAAVAGSGKLLTFNSIKKDLNKELVSAGGVQADVSSGPPSGVPSPSPQLPPGWTQMTSKSNGKVYYWNAELQQSQYEMPKL